MTEETKGLEPHELFDYVKSSKFVWEEGDITKDLTVIENKMNKAKLLFQRKQLSLLKRHAKILIKERVLVNNGINNVVRGSDLHMFIKKMDETYKDKIALVELENYMREIPDDVMDDVSRVLDLQLFDDLVVLYTDFSGEKHKFTKEQQEEIDRNKDPIIFGIFYDDTDEKVFDRLYYITDWVDEFCDLTLDKYMKEMLKFDKKYEISDITRVEDSIKKLIKDNPKEKDKFTIGNVGNIISMDNDL